MEITTFNDDLLGLEDFAHRLERFIKTECNFVEGSLVIGLSSKFGSGKTTFLRMWMASLQDVKNKEEKPLIIFLNAWESDYYGDPLFAIISALIDSIKKEERSAEKLINAAKDFGWFSLAIGNQIVSKITGINAIKAGGIAEDKKRKRKGQLSLFYNADAFSIYEARKNAMLSLKKPIEEIIQGVDSQVLFLVDELDRCRPDYAISYLETIKHIFDIKGAVFLLAADRQQLENSAKAAFGPDLDFDEYYRKFIHREILLPEISDDKYRVLASKYVKFYLEGNGYRKCFIQVDSHNIDNISELIGALKLTPRQIQEVFRVIGHLFSADERNKGRLRWCLAIGSVLMAALKVGRPKIFHILGSGALVPQEAIKFFRDQLNIRGYDWWFTLCLTGGGLKIKKEKQYEDIFKDIGLVGKGDELSRNMYHWQKGWGHSTKNRFSEIQQKIEQLYQWI